MKQTPRLIKQYAHRFKRQQKQRQAVYPSMRFVFRGSGGCLRHVGVAVGSVEGAEGRRGPVGRFGERDIVRVCIAPKHKTAEGVAVGQDDHRLHQLSQRPALLAQQRLEHREEVSARPHGDANDPPGRMLFTWMCEQAVSQG